MVLVIQMVIMSCAFSLASNPLRVDLPKVMEITDYESEKSLPDSTAKRGPLDLEFKNPIVFISFSHANFAGNELTIRGAAVEMKYGKVIGKNISIFEIPDLTVHTVRREKIILGRRVVFDEPVVESRMRKERKETQLFTISNARITVEAIRHADLLLKLPAHWELELTSTDGKTIIQVMNENVIRAEISAWIRREFPNSRLNEITSVRSQLNSRELESLYKLEGEEEIAYEMFRNVLEEAIVSGEIFRPLIDNIANNWLGLWKILRVRVNLESPQSEKKSSIEVNLAGK